MSATIDFNEGDFTASSVEARIDARTLRTHDERRDAHLQSADFLDVEQCPTITFKSTRTERAAHDQYTMTGEPDHPRRDAACQPCGRVFRSG